MIITLVLAYYGTDDADIHTNQISTKQYVNQKTNLWQNSHDDSRHLYSGVLHNKLDISTTIISFIYSWIIRIIQNNNHFNKKTQNWIINVKPLSKKDLKIQVKTTSTICLNLLVRIKNKSMEQKELMSTRNDTHNGNTYSD